MIICSPFRSCKKEGFYAKDENLDLGENGFRRRGFFEENIAEKG
jgi:hypothetical protein